MFIIRVFMLGLILNSAEADDAHEPIQIIEANKNLDPQIISIGRDLFHDVRLSSDQSVSCASCHILSLGGADRLPVSIGVKGRKGQINAPTVYNLIDHIAYFWDGRAKTLEEQINGPLHNPVEMDMDWPSLIQRLKADPSMRARFEQAFPRQGISRETIARALADFMRSLQTINSPFDLWLKGDEQALTPQQIRGYRLFKDYGCIACHQGKNVGANMYATMGAMADYFQDRGKPITAADLGRYNVTGDEKDKHVFKVPSLRLVTLTPPYFHDAEAKSLEEAIHTMAYYQLGRKIPDQDVQDIIAFLKSLVGQHPLLSP